MALNSKTIQRITKTSTSDVAHSSGYANVQNAGNFGAASSAAQSFEGRLDIEKNRKIVQGYRRAMVAQRVNTYDRARTYEEQLAIEKAKRKPKQPKTNRRSKAFWIVSENSILSMRPVGLTDYSANMQTKAQIFPQDSKLSKIWTHANKWLSVLMQAQDQRQNPAWGFIRNKLGFSNGKIANFLVLRAIRFKN